MKRPSSLRNGVIISIGMDSSLYLILRIAFLDKETLIFRPSFLDCSLEECAFHNVRFEYIVAFMRDHDLTFWRLPSGTNLKFSELSSLPNVCLRIKHSGAGLAIRSFGVPEDAQIVAFSTANTSRFYRFWDCIGAWNPQKPLKHSCHWR